MITPERGFMRLLKNLDKRLDCVFRKEHEHFVIVYDRGYGQPVNLLLVKRDDGGFRQPDMREIAVLSEGDMEKQRVKDRLEKTAKYMHDVRSADDTKRKDMIRNMTKDDKIQLRNAFNKMTGAGKKIPAYRPI
ncbi:MAG: hypothetical protein WC332_00920 [Clostridia bacterium]|jgi:hypothetical protein